MFSICISKLKEMKSKMCDPIWRFDAWILKTYITAGKYRRIIDLLVKYRRSTLNAYFFSNFSCQSSNILYFMFRQKIKQSLRFHHKKFHSRFQIRLSDISSFLLFCDHFRWYPTVMRVLVALTRIGKTS